MLDLRDCCSALDAAVVIVIVIITALAAVVAVRFIDFPTQSRHMLTSLLYARVCVCVCLFVSLCVRLKIFSIKL